MRATEGAVVVTKIGENIRVSKIYRGLRTLKGTGGPCHSKTAFSPNSHFAMTLRSVNLNEM